MSYELLLEAAVGRGGLDELADKTRAVLIPVQLLKEAGLVAQGGPGGTGEESSPFDEPTDATRVALVPVEALREASLLRSAVTSAVAAVSMEALVAPVPSADDDAPAATMRLPVAPAPQAVPRQAMPLDAATLHAVALPELVDGDGAKAIDLGDDDGGAAAPSSASARSAPPVAGEGLDDADFFAERSNSFRLDQLLADGESDAVVIGDPTNVAGHVLCEVTVPGRPPLLRDVLLGSDVAQLSLPQAIVKRTGRDDSTLALSALERFALRQIDGVRTNATIREHMRISADDLRLVLSLLADKELITLVAVPGPRPVARAPAAPPVGIAVAAGGAPGPSPPATLPVAPLAPAAVAPPVAPPVAPLAAAASAPLAAAASAPLAALAGAPDTVPNPPAPAVSHTQRAASHAMSFGHEKTNEPSQLSTRSEPGVHSQDTDVPWAQDRSASRAGAGALGGAARAGGLVVDNAQSQANTRFEEAVRLIKRGEATKARRLIEVAQALVPDDTRFTSALAEWRAFVAIHETAPDQRAFARAVRAEALGDIQGAMELLRQATSMNPEHANAWNRLGLLLARNRDLQGAVDALSRAVELAPNDPSILANFSRVAEAHERSGGLDGKLRALWRRFVG